MRGFSGLTLGYIKYFWFLGCIRISMWVTRASPSAGDWLADRLGVTAAYQRSRRWLEPLPRTGNSI